MDRFYWLIPGQLAGCSQPGEDGYSLSYDLAWLEEQGIRAVLSLTETALRMPISDRSNLVIDHCPIPDMTAPGPEQLIKAVRFIDAQTTAGRPVAVHCRAGLGRTGTILAVWLVEHGENPLGAIDRVRTVCPGAIETVAQEESIITHFRDLQE